MTTVNDMLCVALVVGEFTQSPPSSPDFYAIQNKSLIMLNDIIMQRLDLERNRAFKLGVHRVPIVDRCGIMLGIDLETPRDRFRQDGRLDAALENLILKTEVRSRVYELVAVANLVSAGEENIQLKRSLNNAEQRYNRAEGERVTLKVQLENALTLTSNGAGTTEDGMVYITDSKGNTIVKGGTVQKLVERLFSTASEKSDEYTKVFLLTYRSFMSPKALLEMVINKYKECLRESGAMGGTLTLIEEQKRIVMEKTRFRVVAFLQTWIDNHFHDFGAEPELLGQLFALLKESQNDPMLSAVGIKVKKATEAAVGTNKKFVFATPPPEPHVPLTQNPANLSLDFIDPLEFARQLTLKEHELLRAIEPHELLSCGWAKKDKELRSPHLLAMIQHFNDVAAWVGSVILHHKDIFKRVETIKKILRVIEECQKLKNYFAVFELSGGLNCSAVNRLHRTWDEVARSKVNPQKVMAITQPNKNYSAYRDIVATAVPPFIPYLGLYLSDLTFIEDGNPDTLADGAYVNFEKCSMVAKVIQDLCKHQLQPYNFTRVDVIQHWMNTWDSPTEKELFDLSLQVEPRGSSQQ